MIGGLSIGTVCFADKTIKFSFWIAGYDEYIFLYIFDYSDAKLMFEEDAIIRILAVEFVSSLVTQIAYWQTRSSLFKAA